MNYTTKTGVVKDYIINPHGVVQQQQVSYLIANYVDQEPNTPLRQFTLHRINTLEVTTQSASRDPAFNIKQYLQEGGLDTILYPEKTIELHFTKSSAQHLYETPLSGEQNISVLKNGKVSVKAPISITQSVKWWILGFGDQVEVVKPKALRDEMKRIAEGMASLYK